MFVTCNRLHYRQETEHQNKIVEEVRLKFICSADEVLAEQILMDRVKSQLDEDW